MIEFRVAGPDQADDVLSVLDEAGPATWVSRYEMSLDYRLRTN